MHKYRTHNCKELSIINNGQITKLSGWVHRKRDHGGLLFIDLRDHYGITQLVFDGDLIERATKIHLESVITITGSVVAREQANINRNISTGEIEVIVETLTTESTADILPFNIHHDHTSEDVRLKYRFLDLRREEMQRNIILRTEVIQEIRNIMHEHGFREFNTPILTASSPEGARDFLVPSRLHPGKFYALPQAPQQFKQLIMISGFDKYFQIAPCFRDEDSRADRAPGEFYQLDLEMSFATQEDIFNVVEDVLYRTFTKFSDQNISQPPFPQITYKDAMLKYGTDKPDLRNPIEMSDVTDIFKNSGFSIFANSISRGSIVRAIPYKSLYRQPRGFFDKMLEYAVSEGAKGLGYITFDENGNAKGPIAKFLTEDEINLIKRTTNITKEDGVFFICDVKSVASKLSGKIRTKLGQTLPLEPGYKFCWIIDFPFYELDEHEKIIFSHNPFSMPQGELEILESARTTEDIINIRAYQYDIVCNGIELSSGAIRNHKLDIMYKAFEIAGYSKQEVEEKFGGILRAFKFGVPPHGGCAPGIDRIVMMLANSPNIREVILFPLNQQAQDPLMEAPAYVDDTQLKELHIKTLIEKQFAC